MHELADDVGIVEETGKSPTDSLVRNTFPSATLDYERAANFSTIDEIESLKRAMEGHVLELKVQDKELGVYKSENNRLRAENLKYKDIFESAPIGYFTIDHFMQVIEINTSGADILGKRINQVVNSPFPICVVSEDREAVTSHISAVFSGKSCKLKTKVLSGLGEPVAVTLYSHPVRIAGKTGFCCQTAMMDISEHSAVETELRKAKDYLEHAATHDALTKLPNRLFFGDQLGASVVASRRSGKKIAVLLLDLDRFKYVNDTLGHQVGDELLIEVARRLKLAVREFDTVARLGGDEFTVILERIESLSEVSQIAEIISRELAKPFYSGTYEVCTAASMGVCVYPTDSLSPEELVRFADAAMYRAKSLGRNNTQFFTNDLNAELHRKFSLENDLRMAIREGQFELLYQPKYDVRVNKVVGLEALLRWNHPVRGLLTPDLFIDIAEESGFIEQLGDWILTQACETLVRLHGLGFTSLKMSVNLSAKQFNKPTLRNRIVEILTTTNTQPEYIELELTESALLEDAGHSIKTLHELRDVGVELSIDDFGTGYSSLSRLRRLPLSRIKIDKSFVFGLPANQDDCAITRAIVSMAHDLGLEVVSEGVETLAQAEYLTELGCEYIQGYLVSKPIAYNVLVQRLSESVWYPFRATACEADGELAREV